MESLIGQLLIIVFVIFTILGFVGVFRLILKRAEDYEQDHIPEPFVNVDKKNR